MEKKRLKRQDIGKNTIKKVEHPYLETRQTLLYQLEHSPEHKLKPCHLKKNEKSWSAPNSLSMFIKK